MFNSIKDFMECWKQESESTLKVFKQLTDVSLKQTVTSTEGRSLGRLANHIIETLTEMPSKLGLPITEEKPMYTKASELVNGYEKVSNNFMNAVKSNWTDATLQLENNLYGESWKNKSYLQLLAMHQAHHRGQMTILMRQAGLKVPGVYGPSKEEWAMYNMPAMN